MTQARLEKIAKEAGVDPEVVARWVQGAWIRPSARAAIKQAVDRLRDAP